MRIHYSLLAVLMCGLYASTGCATIVHGGTTQKILVESTPAGAKVQADNSDVGETPVKVKLKRDKEHKITVKKEGHEPKDVKVQSSVSGWIAGNILLGGIVGFIVDLVSGGGYTLDPETVKVTLDPISAPAVQPAAPSPIAAAPALTAAKAAPAPARQGPVGIAVYPFGAKGGVAPALAEGLYSVFAAKVAEAPCTRIVAEDIIQDLARQQGLEQACGSESCQVDLAKQAKADVMIRGDIAQVGNSVMFTALAIDLASKATLYSETIRSESNEDDLIRNSQELGRRMAGHFACAM